MKISSPISKGLHSDAFLFWGHVKFYAKPKIKINAQTYGSKIVFCDKKKIIFLKNQE